MSTRSQSSALETLWKTAKNAPMLSAEVELKLAREAQAGSERAFNQLLTAHLRLVLATAHKFAKYGPAQQDLISEGMLGLVEAARRFNPERGARLATYAAWWIHAYMRQYTIVNRRIVRAPSSRHGRKLMAHMRSTQRELQDVTGEAPDAQAVAQKLGVGVRDVEEMEAALSGWDVSCTPDADGHAWPLTAEDASPEQLVADAEERQVSREVIAQALTTLRSRDREIIERLYLRDEPTTLAAMGRTLGLSRERVRQLKHHACDHIRHAVAPALA